MSEKRLYVGVGGGSYPDGESVYQVAVWSEYGTEFTPPRPAFRMGLERAMDKNKQLIKAYLNNVIMDAQRGDSKQAAQREDKLLTQIGRSAVSEVKSIIMSGETATNAPSTVRAKGFNHPLFERGTLANSVEYSVE